MEVFIAETLNHDTYCSTVF